MSNYCKSVFKDGATTTSEASITKKWIELINQIEKGKAVAIP